MHMCSVDNDIKPFDVVIHKCKKTSINVRIRMISIQTAISALSFNPPPPKKNR